MPIDERLAGRIREYLAPKPGFSERRMFGGLCFMLRGHMTAGVVAKTLMLRVGPDQYDEALAQPHAREMDFTGRPLKGMVYVDEAGIRTGPALARWLDRAVMFVSSQPPKPTKATARATRPRAAKRSRR
jgi:TfoX/Sxy family transcriptional regulator of competence genes